MLLQKQINAENDKKKTDKSKIKEWERQIQELGEEAAEIINEVVETIIGGTAEDIAKELGDAFIEAFLEGENAAKAWGEKVDEIVADIMKQMLVSKFVEERIGDIFDQYKSKWFKDGVRWETLPTISTKLVRNFKLFGTAFPLKQKNYLGMLAQHVRKPRKEAFKRCRKIRVMN